MRRRDDAVRRCWVLGLVAVLLTACGGDDDADSDDNSAPASASAASDASDASVDVGADQAEADARVAALVERLEADGFTEAPDDGEDTPLEFESEECEELEVLFAEDEEIEGSTADAELPSFERGGDVDGNLVEGGVGFVEEPEQLEVLLDFLRDDLFGQCMEEGMQLAMEDAPEGEPVPEVSDMTTSVEEVSDDHVSLTMAATINVEAFSLDFEFVIDFARSGRSAAYLLTGGFGAFSEPVDREAYLAVLLGES
jgi:hypothetical protein